MKGIESDDNTAAENGRSPQPTFTHDQSTTTIIWNKRPFTAK